jgi:simple sugar transport system permease protein
MQPFDAEFFRAAILIASPLLIVALGELVSETAGVINVGLEGMMLVGAFGGFWGAAETHNVWIGVLVGLLAGLLLAVIMAVATIEARADQIVVGVALNIIGAGVSVFAFQQYVASRPNIFIKRMASLTIPGLEQLPLLGSALFRQIPLVYVSFALVPLMWIAFFKTRWGLRIRAAGEVPEADETAGVSVRRLRWQGVLIAGALAGVGGAFLSIGLVGTFLAGITSGRGFLALAAVIVGGWRPLGVFGAALLFGGADALQLRLQSQAFVPRSVWIVVGALAAIFLVHVLVVAPRRLAGAPGPRNPTRSAGAITTLVVLAVAVALIVRQPHVTLPSLLWLAFPYALTIAVLAGVIGRVRQPSALGNAFVRGGDA